MEKRVLDAEGLEPRVDSPAWSLMAWVQLQKNGGANILRKPLGKSQAERELSCWSWYVGTPSDRFDFGAHDFRGGSLTSELQESVAANASAAADGLLHNVALVVTSSNITFYMDAKVQVSLITCKFVAAQHITLCVFDLNSLMRPFLPHTQSLSRTHTHTNTHTHAHTHTGCREYFASRDRLQRPGPRVGRRKHPKIG